MEELTAYSLEHHVFEGEEEKIYARAQNMGGFVLSIRLRNRTSHGKKKGKIKKKKRKN